MSATLKAEARDRAGKGASRALRREGRVPAVIYGDNKSPLSISVAYNETMKRIQQGGFLSTVLEVEVGGDKHRVIPRDYQLDPVRDFLVHIDFLRVSKSSVINVEVPVHFVNEEASPGLKRGGVLNVVRHTVELSCPADSIPEAIELDLADAETGDSLHISKVKLPEGVKPTITDRDFTIATIAAPSALKSEDNADDAAEGEGDEAAAEGGEE